MPARAARVSAIVDITTTIMAMCPEASRHAKVEGGGAREKDIVIFIIIIIIIIISKQQQAAARNAP